MILEEVVSPCSLGNVSGEDDEGEQWIIFYTSEEDYKQVLEDTGRACNCLEETKLSEEVEVCSRARNLEARVTPAESSLSFTQVERILAVYESLGFKCADRREIVFDPGGRNARNAPRRKTVESVLRESSYLSGDFLRGDGFGIEQREFDPVRKIFDPGGRELFSTWCYV